MTPPVTPDVDPREVRAPAPSSRAWWFGLGAGALLVALGVVLVVLFLPRVLNTGGVNPPSQASAPAPAATATRTIQAMLYYVSAEGTALVPVSRDVPFAETPAAQARRLVEAQIQTPPAGQRSTIPPGTVVRAVFLTGDGRAYVDLGGPIVTGHAGGSLNEALTVYAIVHVLTSNLPSVTAVQVLVEGKEVDSLTGHLDLRHPLGRSDRWILRGQ